MVKSIQPETIVLIGNIQKDGSVIDGRQIYIQENHTQDGTKYQKKYSVAVQDCDKFEKLMDEKKSIADSLNQQKMKNPDKFSTKNTQKRMVVGATLGAIATAALGAVGGFKLAKSKKLLKYILATTFGFIGGTLGAMTGTLVSLHTIPGFHKAIKNHNKLSKLDIVELSSETPQVQIFNK